MTDSVFRLFGLFLYIFLTYLSTKINCDNESIVSLAVRSDPRLNELKQIVNELIKNDSNFYNYSIICGGNDFDSRFNKDKSFVDQTIPFKFKEFLYDTFTSPSERKNKCPKWSNNNGDDFYTVRAGGMESIKISENSKIGQKFYTLTAIDPESKPIYYFIRKAETENEKYPDEEIIFDVNSIRFGVSWIGEVILNRKLDFETKNSYSYLTYAFDGENLIEKYSNIEITDVDDEKPIIDTSNKIIYDDKMKRFHFKINENLSINDIINPLSNNTNIKIEDIDTKTSQLRLYLTFADSGFGDTPFSINNNGEIKVINNLDYEILKEYFLKLSVKDTADNEVEAFIHIELINMPDLPPKFIKPFEDDERITHYLSFYENKLGKVFDLEAVSLNKDFSSSMITYEVGVLSPNEYAGHFELKKEQSNQSWYLDCIKKIHLSNIEDSSVEQQIRLRVSAIETSSDTNDIRLINEKFVNLRILNGDLCMPKFDREIYEFEVAERNRQLLEPIYVEDCDFGENGEIYFETTNKNFTFKVKKVYRESKLALEMLNSYIYAQNLTRQGNIVEFDIIARGSNRSLNKFETRSKVRIIISDLNDYSPEFILPEPAYILKNGLPTHEQQRIFSYKVPEHEDFSLDVKAIDRDEGSDGRLWYTIGYLKEENFKIITHLDNQNHIYKIRIPGQYLDSKSQEPIIFTVICEDYGEPKLKSDIIIYVRPQSTSFKPIYFEFNKYEFELIENNYNGPFKLKLINDNLKKSKVIIKELHDPLNLLSLEYEDLNRITISEEELTSYRDPAFSAISSIDSEIENELSVLLYPLKKDFDYLYLDNNKSDIYIYKLRAFVEQEPEIYTDLTIHIKIIDTNDNKPKIIMKDNEMPKYLNASLNANFTSTNNWLKIENNDFSLIFQDEDFSDMYGLRSLYFKLNDTRFAIDFENISMQVNSDQYLNNITVPIKVIASKNQFEMNGESIIWLNLTCQDSFFNQIHKKYNTKSTLSTYVLIRVQLIPDNKSAKLEIPVFNKESYIFTVNESYLGIIGQINTFTKENQAKKSQINFKYILDFGANINLAEYFKLINNEIHLIQPFDYELGQRLFRFSILAYSHSKAVFLAKAQIIVLVNDTNDEIPMFSKSEYEFTFNKNLIPTNQIIGKVYVSDLDNEDHGLLEITSQDQKFEIFKSDNFDNLLQEFSIRTNEDVSLENDDEKKIEFKISVKDRLDHVSETNCIINYIPDVTLDELKWYDVNNDTKITSNYSYEIIRKSLNGFSFKIIARFDPDIIDSNYKIKYKLVETSIKTLNNNFPFELNEDTGEIVCKISNEIENDNLFKFNSYHLFAQAYYIIEQDDEKLTKTKKRSVQTTKARINYWSPIVKIKIKVIDENTDLMPLFILPTANDSLVLINSHHINAAKDTLNLYKFLASSPYLKTDENKKNEISYKIIEICLTNLDDLSVKKDCPLVTKLPFKIENSSGNLTLDLKSLKMNDYINLLQTKNHDLNSFTIKLKVEANDSSTNITNFNYLNIEFHLNHLKDLFVKSIDQLPKIEFDLESGEQANEEKVINDKINRTEIYNITHSNTSESTISNGKIDHVFIDAENSSSITDNSKNIVKAKKHSNDDNIIIIKKIDPVFDDMFNNESSVQINKSNTAVENFEISLNESLTTNTVIATLKPTIKDFKLNNQFSQQLKIKFDDNNETDLNPESYISYDQSTGEIKLIRKLDSELIKNFTFSLVDVAENDINNLNSTSDSSMNIIKIKIIVKDVNNKPPKLELDNIEKLNGDNLIIVSINNLNKTSMKTIGKSISSTLPPPRPLPIDIPEMNFTAPKLPPMPSFENRELTQNMKQLSDFSNTVLIKTYKISDPDNLNNFSVKFKNDSSEVILSNFLVETNQTHILVKKKLNNHTSSQNLTSGTSRFNIELNDGNKIVNYSGEIFNFDVNQIEHFILHAPLNGRYAIEIYKSTLPNVKLDIQPPIQIRNIFPFDVYLNLEGNYAKYFHLSNPKIKPIGLINFLPHDVSISLKEPLENSIDIMYSSLINIQLRITSNNSYVNQMLQTIGLLKIKVNIKNQNKYEPQITSVTPEDGVIELNEGYHNRKLIASIKAYDKDRGDPGRLEYFVLGPNMLDIDRGNGSIFLTGVLDAESQPEVVFHAFARDLSPAPAGMSSKLQEFRINVIDVNEFKPIIQPSLYLLSINENDASIVYPTSYVKSLELECYDRDINSTLTMSLNSVRYVYKHESTIYMDDLQPNENNRHFIQDLFKIIFNNNTNNRTTAHLALTKPIDYEKLFKPNETNIRIDIVCSDGKYESLSKIIVNVHDQNDNSPIFKEKNLTIRRNESNFLYNLIQVKAVDLDLSAQYGNESLVYSINKCTPDIYKIYIDKLSGHISSKLIIDLDTKEIIEKRKQIYKILYENNTHIDELTDEMKKEIEFMKNFNRVTCEINVRDSLDQSVHSLNDSMSLTIEIDDMNDNKPEIDPGQELVYELKEGEGYGYRIAQIRIFDKDDARGLECLFSNGFRVFDSFELVTGLDKIDPYHSAWCSLKVRDSEAVEYDVIKRSTYVLDIDIIDTKPKPPTYPNPGRTSFQVIIKVIPVNHKPPMFLNGEKETFYVVDSVRPGFLISTIAAIDMDNPNPDRIIYKLDSHLSSQYTDKFELKQYKKTTKKYWGSVGLVTKSKLNASESPYILSIIAYDGPPELKDTLFSQKLVSIVILNKGSMSVWYDSSNGLPVDYYSIDLEEHTKPDQVILRVQAKIPDSEHDFDSKSHQLNNVEYSIEPEPNMQTNIYYKIDRLTGELSTTDVEVDYEEKDKNKLQLMRNIRIRASSIDNYLSYVTHVSVNIIDKNDNKPIFTDIDRIFYLVENQTTTDSNQFIAQFYAHDLDSDLNGLVEYKLSDDNPIELNGLFELNKTSGSLYLLRSDLIDREENDTIELILTCYDNHGNPSNSLNTSAKIIIRVLDVNDNHPQFINLNKLNYEIEENDLDFELKIDAVDLDFGNNSTLTFSLDKNLNSIDVMQKFTINSMTGLFSLISPLDYETKTNYDIFITCSDNGQPEKLNSTIKLNVQVIDKNDHMPAFRLNKFITNIDKIYLNESINYGDYIVRVEAVDQDPTIQFRNTSYSIDWLSGRYFLNNSQTDLIEKINLFTIDSVTGEIKFGNLERLNFSNINEYIIGLRAVDQDKPDYFFDTFNLTLVLRPSNLKIPIFDQLETNKEKVLKLFRRGLSESTPNNYMIDIVKAHDPNQHGIKYYLDSVKDIKNNTIISLTSNSDLFSIDENTGIVKAIGERSKYMADSYKLNVRAVSILNENLNNTMDLIVNIDSSQDSLFDSHIYEIDLEENSEKDLIIFRLTPKETSGRKTLNLKFEFNEKYSTPTNLYKKWFKLNELDGYISTNTDSIDYEKYNETLLSINVYDSSTLDLIENVLLKVNIIDLNDNKPEFDMSYNYKPSILEDDLSTVNKERFITKFKATDLDGTYLNSKIEYSIVDTTSLSNSFKLVKLFNSNEEIGLYKLSGVNLDRDNPIISNHIDLVILVQDMAKDELDRLNNEIKVKITLDDINDNYPIILNKEDEIELKEDYPLNKQFYQIKATDIDDGINAELAFRIYDEESLDVNNNTIKTSFVSIDKNGYLYLVSALDFERESEVNVTIAVFDKSSSPKTTFKSILIKILNINDNLPTMINLPNDNSIKDMNINCIINVNEGQTSKGKFLYQFNASDSDSDDLFEFDIIKVQSVSPTSLKHKDLNKNIFKLEKQTGKLYVNSIFEMDREVTELYKLIIKLKDREIFGQQFETLHSCLIRVLDINDNKPQFIDINKMEFKILPIINELTFIHWFSTRDLDMGNNGTVEYSISYPAGHESTRPTSTNLFKINSNGYLYLNLISENNENELISKYQLNDLYELEIIATDLGTPERLNASISIKIRIDPNYFKFSQSLNNQLDLRFKNDIVYIDENSRNATLIDKVSVMNSYNSIFKPKNASKSNNKISLEFKLLTCENIFSIDLSTGELYIKNSRMLDFEDTNEFLIQVEAIEIQMMTDLRQQRIGRTSLMVKLNNINDNPPEFNSNQYVYSINENEHTIPTQLSLDLINNNLIILSDLDLLNDNGQNIIKNQINPIDIRLNGSDSTPFRLIKLDYKNSKNFKFALEAIEKLDYETKSSYEFSIIANDGKFKSSAQITVNLNDLNDNKPQFDSKLYNFDLDENSPVSTTIGVVHAKDNDKSPINMIVYYKILNINIKPGVLNENKNGNNYIQLNDLSLFKINEKTGELTVNNNKLLDREQIDYFNLTIIAYNYGDYLNMIDRTTVIIYLKDLNDNAPILNFDFLTLNIREKSKTLPRKILDLDGQDYDLNENGTINFRIHSVNGIEIEQDSIDSNEINRNISNFYIHPLTGQLFLNSYFDLDEMKGNKWKNFELVIEAYDLGPNADKKITKCTIFVNVIDVNDHEPTFLSPLKSTFEYDEDSNGLLRLNELKYLFNVNCRDSDYSNNKIKYFLEHDLNDDWSYFELDETNGHLYSKYKFDYELKKEYNLKLICKDIGGIMIDHLNERSIYNSVNISSIVNDLEHAYPLELYSKAKITIKINDIDDNEPEFGIHNETIWKDVPDNLELDSIIFVLPIVFDRDSYKSNTKTRYIILSGNEHNNFELNETTGELKLIDELDRKEKDLYKLIVKATSKVTLDSNSVILNNNDKSIIRVNLNIVKDKLFIEFDEQNYFISYQLTNSTTGSANNTLSMHKQYRLNNNDNFEINSLSMINSNKSNNNELSLSDMKNSAIFYSRAHLKQRKMKKSVKFNIEMIQLIRSNEKIPNKLNLNSLLTVIGNKNKINWSNANLFIIDENNGKIYLNRFALLQNSNYLLGDRFVLSISATPVTNSNDNQTTIIDDELIENTMTHLTIRLTEKDYSFVMPLNNININDILFNYLNPLRDKYIPRILEADGVKISIQDLLSKSTNKIDTKNYLIVQVETKFDHKQVDLDLFINLWRNYSSSNLYLKELNSFIDREPSQDARIIDPYDQIDSNKLFYTSWLFWLLFIIGILLIIILIFFICCIKLTKKQQTQSKQSGIVIEYPSNVNPLDQDGVISLKNKSFSSLKKNSHRSKVVKVDLDEKNASMTMMVGDNDYFEEQELHMNINDDDDILDNDQLITKKV